MRCRGRIGVADDLESNGKHEDALHILREAFHEAPKCVEPAVLTSMASCYLSLRRFREALLSQELAHTVLFEPDSGDFALLAVYYKNADMLDSAISSLREALELNPENWWARLHLAGYLIRAKKDEEGWAMFKTVEKPPVEVQAYETSLAWFYGSAGKKKEFLEHLGAALDLATEPSIVNYVNTEVDFDSFRADAEFKALMEKHRKRLVK